MLQKEFEDRTGVKVSSNEYSAIEMVYMKSDLDKDDFCHMWCKMNVSRVKAAKSELAAKKSEEKDRSKLLGIIGKIYKESQSLSDGITPEPLTIFFLSADEVCFLKNKGIKMRISNREAIEYGYLTPRYYTIRETAYQIKKYLKIA